MKVLNRKKDIQKKARGASSNAPMPSKRFNWMPLKKVLVVSVFLVLVGAVYQSVDALLELPVTRVAVAGEFQHVNRKTVVSEIQPFLSAGFVRLDLDAIRETLRQQPWIFDVSLVRKWPDEIVINVEEQSVIAHWGKSGLLNHRGDLFKPEQAVPWAQGAPLLSGPDSETKKVMTHFSELNELLEQYQLSLGKLSLSERNTWSASLENGVEIVLGGSEVMTKMRRFLSAYEQGLSEDFARIKTIDMRYNNGFAIGWRKSAVEKS